MWVTVKLGMPVIAPWLHPFSQAVDVAQID